MNIVNFDLSDLSNDWSFNEIRWIKHSNVWPFYHKQISIIGTAKGGYFPMFHGQLEHLEKCYTPIKCFNIDEMKQYIDDFILKINKLVVFQ